MKTMKVLVGVMFLLLVFGLATNATADLIQNGSFESPVIDTSAIVREAPDSWTTGTNPGLLVNGSGFGGYTPEAGNQYYDLGNATGYFCLRTLPSQLQDRIHLVGMTHPQHLSVTMSLHTMWSLIVLQRRILHLATMAPGNKRLCLSISPRALTP